MLRWLNPTERGSSRAASGEMCSVAGLEEGADKET